MNDNFAFPKLIGANLMVFYLMLIGTGKPTEILIRLTN